jgi:hypothetical protein
MKQLPDMLRRLPFVFYGLAAVFFVWQLANQWASFSVAFQYGDGDGMLTLSKSMALYSALLEAAYMIANGAVIHVLIAIHDKVKGE